MASRLVLMQGQRGPVRARRGMYDCSRSMSLPPQISHQVLPLIYHHACSALWRGKAHGQSHHLTIRDTPHIGSAGPVVMFVRLTMCVSVLVWLCLSVVVRLDYTRPSAARAPLVRLSRPPPLSVQQQLQDAPQRTRVGSACPCVSGAGMASTTRPPRPPSRSVPARVAASPACLLNQARKVGPVDDLVPPALAVSSI